MRAVLRILFAALLCCAARPTPAAEPRHLTVVDYFLQLPDDTLEGSARIWLRFLRQPTCGMEDVANGYLSSTGDGAQPDFTVALFRYPDGRPLLALCQGELEGPPARYLQFFEQTSPGKMRPVKRSIFPYPEEKGYRFDLPRHGRTIIVRDGKSGKIRARVAWTGDRFVVKK